MFTNRLFVLSIIVALVAVAVFAAREGFTPAVVAADAESSYTQTEEQTLRESQLGDRYGELPGYVGGFSSEQLQREYELGERYGETPQQYAREQALREYWLGERYGVTP